MTLFDWINLNLAVDIACVVYMAAVTWKIRKLQKDLILTREDLTLTMQNPQRARRVLKQRQK